ncbi:Nitrosoguanidine resistance SNG1 [Fusarium albosuccineum]|uniref:Nitrosoguanidine resistance SNG1 n=1 Tax=Fusarium albosuccineum TaxID=1237068 RepID=A0A8H4L532_9HYPO|nr:Nitrosoguanidine resistance SNG1 [Fusarium albosuccineum]
MSPALKKARKPFFKAVAVNFLYIQLLFLGLFCYIFGSLFLQTTHIHNLHVIFVDYDGGAIGRAVRAAYASAQGKGFPSLIERPSSDFPSTTDLVESVCKTRYWGALYVTRGASNRLQDALTGSADASLYNKRNVMAYIWDEARYAPTIDSGISANLQLLSGATRVAYSSGNGTGNITSISGPAELSVFADPWELQSINIQPTTQGSRAIYNTLAIVLILIQEFFYLGTINGLYTQFKLYPRLDPHRIIVVRNSISLSYTFIGALCVTGAIWAFKSGWNVNGNQFVLNWVTLWLFAHANFLTLDVFTIWLPHPFVPMALISWIVFNVTSILLPFELSPAFYRVGYIFPAHAVYGILIDVWSGGCNPQLHYALPVLFAWELASFTFSALGVFRRCHFATLGEEVQEAETKERIDTAVAVEIARMVEMKQKRSEPAEPEAGGAPKETLTKRVVSEGRNEEEGMREELELALGRVITRQRRELRRTSTACNFGPSFNLPFTGEENGDDK